MRITYDPDVDAAYIYLTGEPLTPGRDSVVCELPDGSGDLSHTAGACVRCPA